MTDGLSDWGNHAVSLRNFALFPLLAVLVGCGATPIDESTREDLGNFDLAHNIVVATTATVGPLSRKVEPDVWKKYLTDAIDARLRRYDGDKLYHLGTSIDGYVLAVPGIPVVASPKSVLIIGVTLWNDREQRKINEEPEQFTVFESLSGETAISSGLTQSKEQQMENLSRNAAYQIEQWLAENPQWFEDDEPAEAAAEAEPATDDTDA